MRSTKLTWTGLALAVLFLGLGLFVNVKRVIADQCSVVQTIASEIGTSSYCDVTVPPPPGYTADTDCSTVVTETGYCQADCDDGSGAAGVAFSTDPSYCGGSGNQIQDTNCADYGYSTCNDGSCQLPITTYVPGVGNEFTGWSCTVSAPVCTPLTYNSSTSGLSASVSGPPASSLSLTYSSQPTFYAFVDYGSQTAASDPIDLAKPVGYYENLPTPYSCTFLSSSGTVAEYKCSTPPTTGSYTYATAVDDETSGDNFCATLPQNIGTLSVNGYSNPPVNGACGTANGQYLPYGVSSYSPYTQCSSGTPTNTNLPTAGGSYTYWSCAGINGGKGSGNNSCSAKEHNSSYASPGVCGTANGKAYPNGTSSYGSDTQCYVGTSTNPAFPTAGNSTTWFCNGVNGAASSGTCTASQAPAAAAPGISLSPDTFPFNGVSGGATPPAQTLTITNPVSGTTLLWKASTNMPWCHVSQATGSAPYGSPSVVNVSVDAPSNVGSFTCIVTVADNGSSPPAFNSPQTATANYTVTPADACTGAGCGTCSGGVCGGGGGSENSGNGVQTAGASCPTTGIVVSWQPAAGASAYNIYRNTSNTVPGSVYITQTAQNGNSGTQTYTDTAASGGPYYYWVQAVNGSQTSPDVVAANSNSSGVSANTCATGPSAPTGGAASNSGSVSCGTVAITWTDNSTNETGFKIYMDGIYQATAPASSPASQTGQLMSYTFTPPDNNSHTYTVSATSASGDSAKVAETNGAISSTACGGPNLLQSDKDITAINGVNVASASACDGRTNTLPATTSLKLNDVVSFALNVCNTANTSSGPAKNIVITDNMTNLQKPSAGWDMQYCPPSAACVPITPTVSGTSPNQILTINLSGQTINQAAFGTVTFNAQITVPSGFSGSTSRFQNSFSITSNAPTDSGATPLELFSTGLGPPTVNEVP